MRWMVIPFYVLVLVIIILISGCTDVTSSNSIRSFQRPSSIPTGYWQFNNSDMQFSVYLPEDWKPFSSSAMSPSRDHIYIYNESIGIELNAITILSRDITKFPNANIQYYNDKFIEEFKYGLSPTTNIIIKSKEEKYLINGYESVGNLFRAEDKGRSSIIRLYIIKTESRVYCIYYVSADNVYNTQINAVESIIGSFIPSN